MLLHMLHVEWACCRPAERRRFESVRGVCGSLQTKHISVFVDLVEYGVGQLILCNIWLHWSHQCCQSRYHGCMFLLCEREEFHAVVTKCWATCAAVRPSGLYDMQEQTSALAMYFKRGNTVCCAHVHQRDHRGTLPV